ncbi:MAG: hypothetical protein L3J16_00030 [Anaerolineales bacterium]|nr:hypothetical protein [Anaerolineales bacterium]
MKKIYMAGFFVLVSIFLTACNMPASGVAANADTTPPKIMNISTSSPRVYYNDSNCGPTRLTISLDVSDDSGSISTVGLQYRYHRENNFGASLAWKNVSLPAMGNGKFAGELDVSAEAGAILGNGSGALEYQVYAVDNAGNIRTMPETRAESISVQHCNAGIASTLPSGSGNTAPLAPPPQPGSSGATNNGNSASPPQSGSGSSSGNNNGSNSGNSGGSSSGNSGGSSSGGNNNGGGAVLPPAVTLPSIDSFTGPGNAVGIGEIYSLQWNVLDACKVFLDGVEVNASDTTVYTAPLVDAYYTYVLTAWGSPCDASTEVSASVDVSIFSGGIFDPGAGGNGGGNNGGGAGATSITIYNNSSHAIVEFQLDGNELIWSEADSILPGTSDELTGLVSGTTYSYQVGAGFWSGGTRYAIYPLPGGSFTTQDGSITIVDPTVEQIMTEYGSGGYYAGQFWDGTMPGCAAFDFQNDGSFTFYLDGVQDDTGWYYLGSRYPSSYSISLTIQNSSGSQEFPGTYYYSGAMAGTLVVNNGPAGWEQIDYIRNGGCP